MQSNYIPALKPEAQEQVFRLRYKCYRRDGSIAANPNEEFHDEFDSTGNHVSYLLLDGSNPIATVRFSIVCPELGWTNSPARTVYDDLGEFREVAGTSYIEANRLCFESQVRPRAFISLLGNMTALAEHFQLRWLVACPRVEHAHAYAGLFGFRAIGEPRNYHGVKFATQLMMTELSTFHAYTANNRHIQKSCEQARLGLRAPSPARKCWSQSASILEPGSCVMAA